MTISDMCRSKIFLTARRCIGSPFRHQGRHPEYGLDCIGLIVYVARELGLSHFDVTEYKRIPAPEAISRYAAMAAYPEKPRSEMVPGDIVILRFGRYLEHAAILSDRGIIHACEKYGGVVEHRLDRDWRARIILAYSFPAFPENHKEVI